MKLSTLKLGAAACTLAGGAWLSAAALSEPTAIAYKFHEAPLNGLGLQNMEELRGKPIVIDFWGKN